MYNEQLEKFIEMALMDGELTEKEKQILFKKAEAAGIDLNEFEMVLDAKLFEKQQIMKAAAPIFAVPKSDKFGDVKKCPACGAIVTSFSANCVECGHEFSNIEANGSVERLFKLLSDIDNEPIVVKKFLGIEDAQDAEHQRSEKVNKICNVIRNFPVPNTKNDILEFLSSAVPHARNVKTGFGRVAAFFDSDANREQELSKAWKHKCEQIIIKGRFMLKDDKKGFEEINAYALELGVR